MEPNSNIAIIVTNNIFCLASSPIDDFLSRIWLHLVIQTVIHMSELQDGPKSHILGHSINDEYSIIRINLFSMLFSL